MHLSGLAADETRAVSAAWLPLARLLKRHVPVLQDWTRCSLVIFFFCISSLARLAGLEAAVERVHHRSKKGNLLYYERKCLEEILVKVIFHN